jgi:GNAT superfamily N-acetyltransferase
MYTIKTYQIHQLQTYQTAQLGRLSRRGYALSYALAYLIKANRDKDAAPFIDWHRIIVVETPRKKILGWALMRDLKHSQELMMYVDRRFRRQGIGRKLAKRANLINGHYKKRLLVYVVNDQGDFYKKVGMI